MRHPDAVLNLSGRENPPELLGTLSLSGRCIAVSGDYQQYFCADGTYYSHLIDPETLYPARYYRCVCVLADTAREAEVASKALFAAPVSTGAGHSGTGGTVGAVGTTGRNGNNDGGFPRQRKLGTGGTIREEPHGQHIQRRHRHPAG